ncbi:hypothetical protein PSACC_03179 [Paramicrosporidium saccamoebae]|uniref:SUZ domain-containing protein n=1 Tax=Paramicrosporidium saccamoebae TaxID=1246581 RepID=A0A2H9TGX3_9FUNG|nr:hypothetical protein PSACC_03179 [Paramicrosporidium saccamoebae]
MEFSGHSVECNYKDLTVDAYLLTALNGSSKDREFILRIETQIVGTLFRGSEAEVTFCDLNSYYRMLVHRITRYYDLQRTADSLERTVTVYRPFSGHARPLLKLADLAEPEWSVPPEPGQKAVALQKFTIMKRENATEQTVVAKPTANAKSLAEREEQYEIARARIFQNFNDKKTLPQAKVKPVAHEDESTTDGEIVQFRGWKDVDIDAIEPFVPLEPSEPSKPSQLFGPSGTTAAIQNDHFDFYTGWIPQHIYVLEGIPPDEAAAKSLRSKCKRRHARLYFSKGAQSGLLVFTYKGSRKPRSNLLILDNFPAAALCLALAASAHAQLIDKCAEPGQVAVMVDLITKRDGPAVLKALETKGIQALVTIPQNMLTGSDMHSFVRRIKRAKHQFAFRYNVPGKLKLSQLTDTQITHSLDAAKTRFTNIHGVTLKYVVFPYTSDAAQATRLQKLAEKAGLITVSHNMYLDNRVAETKTNLKEIMFSPKEESYIALLEANGAHRVPVLNELLSYSQKQQFTVTSFSKCASGEKETGKSVDTDSDETIEQSVGESTSESGVDEGKKKKVTAAKGVKPGVLVNPEHIKGYKKPATSGKKGKHGKHSNHGKHHRHGKHGKHGKKKTNSGPAGQKLHAKKAKDELITPDPDKVVNPDTKSSKKETVSAQTGVEGGKAEDKVAATSENGASAMSVSAVSLLMVAVASAVALL